MSESQGPTPAPWTARVYGARPIPAPTGSTSDAVAQRIGPPPPSHELPLSASAPQAEQRAQLPALQRRFTRGRIVSLVAYAVSIVVAVVGLAIVGGLAFA